MFHSGGKIPTPLVGFYFETLFSFINSSYMQKKCFKVKRKGFKGEALTLLPVPAQQMPRAMAAPQRT